MDWMSSIYQVMASIFGTAWNAKMQRETNENNRMLVDMQNKAAALESEKAYRRSMPSMQMGQMRAAGLSESAAAQAISGGATYQPAPVNVSQEEAPQIDLSQAIQAVTSSMQMRNERKMQEKMLAAQAAESAANRENAKEIARINAEASKYGADSSSKTAGERLAFDRENARNNWRLIDRQISYIEKQTESLDVQIKGTELDNIRKDMENLNYPTIARLMNERAIQEIETLILEYNQAVENHDLDKRRKQLENRYLMFTEKYRVDAENARNELAAYMDTVHLKTNTPALGLFASLELFVNNYLPTLARMK